MAAMFPAARVFCVSWPDAVLQQAVDAFRDIFPIRQPVARKAEGNVGIADAALKQADACVGHALARAAS